MKVQLILTLLTFTALGCINKHTPKDKKSSVSETKEQEKYTIFEQVSDYPKIIDSTTFITNLRQVFSLEVDESPSQKANEKITTFKKVKIFGSDHDFYFIEYDYGVGCMAAYPWKYQLLITTEGKQVKALNGQRFEFVTIFPDQNPFLMTAKVSAKGNGGHEIYRISADTLLNVYEGYYDYDIRTYDSHEDNRIYRPNELTLKIKDFNADGFNDIYFNGEMVLIQGKSESGDWFDNETINGEIVKYSVDNSFKEIPIEFVFLYNKQTGHFVAKEDYNKKYDLEN